MKKSKLKDIYLESEMCMALLCTDDDGQKYVEYEDYKQDINKLQKIIAELKQAQEPFTIEELKSLQIGDWIWIIYQKEYGVEKFYAQICNNMSGTYLKYYVAGVSICFEDYGKTWIAYKNKEAAEKNALSKL